MKTKKFMILFIIAIAFILPACGAMTAQESTEQVVEQVTEGEIKEEVVGQPMSDYQSQSGTSGEIAVAVEEESEMAVEQPASEEYYLQPTPAGSIAQQPLATLVIPREGEPPEQPDAMYFEDYGVNPFVDTYEDHLSTFALDVDTASYSVARRYINDGNIPPADAIRVEEFVNYFNPGYTTPPEIAFGIYADGARSPFHTDGTHILRFGVQGYEVPDYARKPASLTFVIDVSGSMDRENRLGLVKQSLQMLVDRLRPDDTVSIVVYGSEARVVLYPTSGEDRTTILDAIYSLHPEGSTNAEAGLRLGYQMAWTAFMEGAINRVILCSDGVANVGEAGPDAILKEIEAYVVTGITLTSVGFGDGKFQ